MHTGPIGIGIVGTGRISDLHAIEYLASPLARIVALCDVDTARAAARAAAWGLDDVAVCDDIDVLLARPEVDLVEILLPHHLHLEAALKSVAAGKIVSLQKPMCISLAEADRLVAAAQASDRPFKVFENFLFYPPVVRARELIADGRDRHAALHPHQEQPGAERDRLGRAGKRHRLAAAARAVRRRAAGVRRRPPQVRPRLALHGRAGGGPRLHRA